MTYFQVGVNISGVQVFVPDVFEDRPLSDVAEYVSQRRRVGVMSFIHLGYERPVQRNVGAEEMTEVVYLSHLTTVAQAQFPWPVHYSFI